MTEQTSVNADPQGGQPATQTSDPGSSSPGQSQTATSTEAPSQELPDNFKGKSAVEIASMYQNLEKKLGEQSKEVADVRKLKGDMDQVLQVLWKNPELFQQVERELLRSQGHELPEVRDPKKKGDGEAKSDGNDDIRNEAQTRVIASFEQQFKIQELPTDKRKELNKRIATEFAELRDPSGNKPVSQLIKETPVDQLGKLLEKAYWLAVKESFVERGNNVDIASISTMSASSGKTDETHGLSDREAQVARNLGMTPEEYAKYKKKLNS